MSLGRLQTTSSLRQVFMISVHRATFLPNLARRLIEEIDHLEMCHFLDGNHQDRCRRLNGGVVLEKEPPLEIGEIWGSWPDCRRL